MSLKYDYVTLVYYLLMAAYGIHRWVDINCLHFLVDGVFCCTSNSGVRWWQLWGYVFILLAYVILEDSTETNASLWQCSWKTTLKLCVFDLLLIAEFVDCGYGGACLLLTLRVMTASEVRV